MHSFRLIALLVSLSFGFLACKDSKSGETTTNGIDTTAQKTTMTAEELGANVLKKNKEEALVNIANLQGILASLLKDAETALANAKTERERKERQGKVNFYKEYTSDLEELKIKVDQADLKSWADIASQIDGYHYKIKMSAQSDFENSAVGKK
jgi:hypothetical protein